MFDMGIYRAEIFHSLACLVKVRIIYGKAWVLTMGVGPLPYLVLQLEGYAPQGLSPSNRRNGKETIARIFLNINKSFYLRILAFEDFSHSDKAEATGIGKQTKTHKEGYICTSSSVLFSVMRTLENMPVMV